MLPHWTEHDIIAGGVKTHYIRTGSGGKPPLLLLHGFSDNGLCWLPVARDLEAEWDIYLPDAFGHGLSQRVTPGARYDMPAYAAALIQALGLGQKPVVGGHSMGAASAATMEARFPGTARALLLEDPPWRMPQPQDEEPTQPRENPFRTWIMGLQGQTRAQIIAKGRADSPTWPEVEWEPWAIAKQQIDPNIFQAEGTHMDWQEAVQAIRCPTLLITADPAKGAIVPPEAAQIAAQRSPSITVAQIPNAGHSIRRENYEAYMKAVRAFLATV